jgi:hypothetical protein
MLQRNAISRGSVTLMRPVHYACATGMSRKCAGAATSPGVVRETLEEVITGEIITLHQILIIPQALRVRVSDTTTAVHKRDRACATLSFWSVVIIETMSRQHFPIPSAEY